MSRLVLYRCCGITPLRVRRRGSAIALPSPPHLAGGPRRPAANTIHRDWALRVSAPIRHTSVFDNDKNSPRGRGGEEASGSGSSSEEFDPGAPPPFTLADIRAAIPKHCWVRDTWRSMSYVVRDFVVVFGLAAAAARFDSWLFWPFYWVAQGTMFWALFVIGHDCGHGSFSKDPNLNSVVGHILNAPTLVPYHGWRISHRTHHQNQGHVEKDESWNPLPQRMYNSLDTLTKNMRFTLPFPMLAFPVYLFMRTPGKTGSHFHPNSDVFLPNEKKDVLISTTSCLTMVGVLARLTFVMGPLMMIKLYAIPHVEWSYLRGGLTTIDRDYGLINNIHHDISTHMIHHLFPQIPHYHLVEATKAAKLVLGKYYREPEKSGPLPFHLLKELSRSLKNDRYVSDTGDVVYYQSDP